MKSNQRDRGQKQHNNDQGANSFNSKLGKGMNFIFVAEPDPENSALRFYYFLPRPENVHFEIYDIQGKLVTRISNGWLAPGIHLVFWSTEDLSSGIYLVRFSVREESIVQKVTLSEY
jgi:hypothetical protein